MVGMQGAGERRNAVQSGAGQRIRRVAGRAERRLAAQRRRIEAGRPPDRLQRGLVVGIRRLPLVVQAQDVLFPVLLRVRVVHPAGGGPGGKACAIAVGRGAGSMARRAGDLVAHGQHGRGGRQYLAGAVSRDHPDHRVEILVTPVVVGRDRQAGGLEPAVGGIEGHRARGEGRRHVAGQSDVGGRRGTVDRAHPGSRNSSCPHSRY